MFLLLLLPSISLADGLPNGCYVTDSNPGFCYNGIGTPHDYGSLYTNSLLYGSVVARMQDTLALVQSENASCVSDYNTLVDLYNARTTSLANCNAAYSELNAAFLIGAGALDTQTARLFASQRLVKKLRKACGTRCKTIK